MGLKVYTAAVSLHKHNDNRVLAGIYLGYVPSILVKLLLKKTATMHVLGKSLKSFTSFAQMSLVLSSMFTHFLCIEFSVEHSYLKLDC